MTGRFLALNYTAYYDQAGYKPPIRSMPGLDPKPPDTNDRYRVIPRRGIVSLSLMPLCSATIAPLEATRKEYPVLFLRFALRRSP